ncbi:plasmid segregation protein ParM domain-containing protein [Escherichia coli]
MDGEKFSFDPLSADAVVTTETRYQYSDVNVVWPFSMRYSRPA